jgi:hypothetical protein
MIRTAHLGKVLAAVLLLGTAAVSSAAAAPLSLLGDRFHVDATWRTANGHTGVGTPVSLTGETGYFWFFSPTNVEVVVKALDACASATPRFWIFGAGLTNAEVTLTVTDQATGQHKVYRNTLGQAFQPIQDTGAFATCGTPRCGQGSFAELAASPRVDPNLEEMALLMGSGLTASQPVYDRLVTDVAALRALQPSYVLFGFTPYFNPRLLFVKFDANTSAAVANGTYHAWDCLNRWYGVNQVEAGDPLTIVHFSKVLDQRRLLADYRALPGVTDVILDAEGPNPGTPNPINTRNSFCARLVGGTAYYFVRYLGSFFYYTTEPGGPPVYLGTDLHTSPAPSWLPDAQSCFHDQIEGH